MIHIIITLYGFWLNTLAVIAPAVAARRGFYLFCRPMRGALTDRHRKFLASSDGFLFTHEGSAVQAYRWGNGPKRVLFLHGWQSHTYRWKAYIEHLHRAGYTVYAFDAPGHGLSGGNFLSVPLYSELIDAFIRAHGPMDAVVAHSLGGFSLLYTLFQKPAVSVGRVVVMGTPGEATEFVDVFRNTLGLSQRAVKLVTDYFIRTYNVSPEYFSLKKFVGSLSMEGLIIHDQDDREAPYAYALELHTAWRRSKFLSTSGLGHNLRSPHLVEQVAAFVGDGVTEGAGVLPGR